MKSAEEQWKYVDRINRDAEETLKNNFIVFLEGIFQYFKNLLLPVINGSPLLFDVYGDTVEGAIFSHDFFYEELRDIESLALDIYNFRNNNPTLKVSADEVMKIIAKKISSMNHVEGIVYKTGSSFYALAKKLQEVYHNHVEASGKDKPAKARTVPIRPEDKDSAILIPFSGCLLKGFEPGTPLLKRIAGRKILSETMKGGVIIFIMAYCYQAALLCGYPLLQNDLGKRDAIRKQIKDLNGGSDDTKR